MPSATTVLVTTPWSFQEGLIQAYTLPYIKIMLASSAIERVYLVTEEKSNLKLDSFEADEIKSTLIESGINWLAYDYQPFGLKAISSKIRLAIGLSRFAKNNRVDMVHSWTLPGAVLGYIISKLIGKPLVVDSFEPHAEAQVENGTWTRTSLGFRVLWFFEKRIAKHAANLIYTSKNMINYASEKYNVHDKNEFVKPACVDLDKFSNSPARSHDLIESLKLSGCIVGIYAGKLGGIYHDREFFDFARVAHKFWKSKFKMVFLTADSPEKLRHLAEHANCPADAYVSLAVKHHEVPKYLKLAHFGITLVKSVPSKKCCTPIKNGEYWASGLPVLITPNIGDDSDIITNENIGVVISSFTHQDCHSACLQLEQLINDPNCSKKAFQAAQSYRNFNIAKDIYPRIYGPKSTNAIATFD